ncbi:hypothetical protein AN960_22465 [Bacillus sp. FJAT-25509]|nr:hypothetical protein AN960_22465 [Bacillus sp. FJAT-25509]
MQKMENRLDVHGNKKPVNKYSRTKNCLERDSILVVCKNLGGRKVGKCGEGSRASLFFDLFLKSF